MMKLRIKHVSTQWQRDYRNGYRTHTKWKEQGYQDSSYITKPLDTIQISLINKEKDFNITLRFC